MSALPNTPDVIARPSLVRQWLVWLSIGAFSFGGGAATIILMRREWVERRRWVSGSFFDRAYAMGELAPGITILAIAIQLGRAVSGWAGIIVALMGLMLPAVILTTALTALFGAVESWPAARAAFAGLSPGTVGVLLALAWGVVTRTLFGPLGPKANRRWSRLRDGGLILVCALGFAVFHWPAPLILIGAGIFGALAPDARYAASTVRPHPERKQ